MSNETKQDQKNNKSWLGAGIGILLVIIAILSFNYTNSDKPNSTTKSIANIADGLVAVVNKTATCGCCSVYTKYLPKQGIKTESKDVTSDELEQTRKNFKIPDNLASCHITTIGNYFVSGHIPSEAIEKLLTEKPEIDGIALSGMPSGTPGMPGPKTETWTIYSINQDGSTAEFMKI